MRAGAGAWGFCGVRAGRETDAGAPTTAAGSGSDVEDAEDGGAGGLAPGRRVENFPSLAAPAALANAEPTVDGDAVLTKMLQKYSTTAAGSDGAAAAPAATEVMSQLIEEYCQGTSCLVCLDDIKHSAPVWSCQASCHEMYHLGCIQKWVRDGVNQSKLSFEQFPDQEKFWYCPKCRHKYSAQSEFPEEYTCFCGKERDPGFDPWLTPHSCGEICNKALKNDCGHSCVLLCHPGPCPPCPKVIREARCFCGRKSSARRCGDKNYSCGSVCGSLLGCKTHRCTLPCHDGPCPDCPKESDQRCVCGKESKVVPCAAPPWSCKAKCGKLHPCGSHVCERVCHTGDCGACPNAGARSCPCGKVPSDLPCTADVKPCGSTCDKELPCGVHTCQEKCHRGPCPPCRGFEKRFCRCRRNAREMACGTEFKCGFKCQSMRSCGIHVCKRKCCDGAITGQHQACEEVCNRRLSCGNHRCQAPCHQGPCYPCPLTKQVSCACGETKRAVPCGRERTAKPPTCRKICTISPYCHHHTQAEHACHFGLCPPCPQQCARVHKACGHQCASVCHDRQPDASHAPAAQSVIGAKAAEKHPAAAVNWKKPGPTHCPPCAIKVPVVCNGLHQTNMVECSKAAAFTCRSKCGRVLPCGRHHCGMRCHAALNGQDWETIDAATKSGGSSESKGCGQCDLKCSLPRPKHCKHACPLPCHDGDCPACEESLQFPCHCGSVQLTFGCVEYGAFSAADRVDKLSCHDRCPKDLSCGHRCPMKCHTGGCPPPSACKKRVVAKCDCGRRKHEYVCSAGMDQDAVVCDDECKRLSAEKAEAGIPAAGGDTEDAASLNKAASKARPGAKLEGKARRQQRREERAAAAAAKQGKANWWETPAARAVIAAVLAIVFAWLLLGD